LLSRKSDAAARRGRLVHAQILRMCNRRVLRGAQLRPSTLDTDRNQPAPPEGFGAQFVITAAGLGLDVPEGPAVAGARALRHRADAVDRADLSPSMMAPSARTRRRDASGNRPAWCGRIMPRSISSRMPPAARRAVMMAPGLPRNARSRRCALPPRRISCRVRSRYSCDRDVAPHRCAVR